MQLVFKLLCFVLLQSCRIEGLTLRTKTKNRKLYVAGMGETDEKSLVDSLLQQSRKLEEAPKCKSIIISTYITGLDDWITHTKHKKSFAEGDKFQKSIENVPEGGAEAYVMHDQLSEAVTKAHESPNFHFVKKNISEYPVNLGVNDVRFLMALDLMKAHPEWKDSAVFVTDLFDVTLKHNPCSMIQKNKIYVGKETYNEKGTKDWVEKKIKYLGGDYMTLWKGPHGKDSMKGFAYNAGISGASYDKYLEFLEHVKDVYDDPNTSCRQNSKHKCNANMGVINYVTLAHYKPEDVVSGFPLHTTFSKWHVGERFEADAAIQHKFAREKTTENMDEAGAAFGVASN